MLTSSNSSCCCLRQTPSESRFLSCCHTCGDRSRKRPPRSNLATPFPRLSGFQISDSTTMGAWSHGASPANPSHLPRLGGCRNRRLPCGGGTGIEASSPIGRRARTLGRKTPTLPLDDKILTNMRSWPEQHM